MKKREKLLYLSGYFVKFLDIDMKKGMGGTGLEPATSSV